MKRMDNAVMDMMTVDENFRMLKTGFDNIDSAVGYLRKGCVSLLCSRPGMGERSLAARFGANTAESGGKVVWFSIYNSVSESAREIMNAHPIFRSSQNIFLEDRTADVRGLCLDAENMKPKPDLVIIDRLQGMYRISRKGRAVYDAPHICKSLKDFAVRNDIAVLLISNLTRAPEYRQFHIPLPTDIPNWEKIKKYIDTVGLLHRRGYYEPDSSDIQAAELFIGPCIDSCANVHLLWDSTHARFLTEDLTLK